jgi:hypothetical protein
MHRNFSCFAILQSLHATVSSLCSLRASRIHGIFGKLAGHRLRARGVFLGKGENGNCGTVMDLCYSNELENIR